PMTSQPEWPSKRVFKPCRTMGWSSTKSMRIVIPFQFLCRETDQTIRHILPLNGCDSLTNSPRFSHQSSVLRRPNGTNEANFAAQELQYRQSCICREIARSRQNPAEIAGKYVRLWRSTSTASTTEPISCLAHAPRTPAWRAASASCLDR